MGVDIGMAKWDREREEKIYLYSGIDKLRFTHHIPEELRDSIPMGVMCKELLGYLLEQRYNSLNENNVPEEIRVLYNARWFNLNINLNFRIGNFELPQGIYVPDVEDIKGFPFNYKPLEPYVQTLELLNSATKELKGNELIKHRYTFLKWCMDNNVMLYPA